MQSKKLLLIAATHGDEKIGIQVIKALEEKGYKKFFDYLIANPKALKAKRRFIDCDLNRSYPGKNNSSLYESRLACKNLKIANQYRYIIDIHEASSGNDNFVIVPRKTLSKEFPVQLIELERILLWPDPKGPLSQVLKNAIELEFGMKNKRRTKVVSKAVQITEKFIKRLLLGENRFVSSCRKELFYVYGKMLVDQKGRPATEKLIDFRLARINKEKFYPLLTGQYLSQGIVCYKMKKLKSISYFQPLPRVSYQQRARK